MPLRHDIRRGALCMLAAHALFTGMGAIVKHLADHIPVIELMFFRSAFALPVILLNFERLSVVAPLANVVVVPLVPLVPALPPAPPLPALAPPEPPRPPAPAVPPWPPEPPRPPAPAVPPWPPLPAVAPPLPAVAPPDPPAPAVAPPPTSRAPSAAPHFPSLHDTPDRRYLGCVNILPHRTAVRNGSDFQLF